MESASKKEIPESLCYRARLRNELLRRRQKNRNYSLRAFARDLCLSPARLSRVLRGHFGLSPQAAQEIAGRLELKDDDRLRFLDSVESQHSRDKKRRVAAMARLEAKNLFFRTLEASKLAVFSNWKAMAILEIVESSILLMDEWHDTSLSLATRLSMSPEEASALLHALLDVRLLEQRRGRLRSTGSHVASSENIPSAVIRQGHHDILAKATEALRKQPPAVRDFSAMVFSFDAKDLPEAKKALRDFRRAFNRRFSKGGRSRSEIYCLGLQFFSLESQDVSSE